MRRPEYVDTPDNFYRDSKTLIERYHRHGRNLYAITPRFALGASHDLLERCQQLKVEHPDCWVSTHISENPAECRAVLDQNPDCPDYLGVYEKYGLVGPKFSGGHGVWLSDDEFRRMSDQGAAVVFCPCSNLFLGSGLFRIGRATDPRHRVKMCLGSDIGGGNRFSMLHVLDEAYKIGMCNNTLLDGSIDPARHDSAEAERNKISPYRGFWSVTLGAAEALYIGDMLGNFQPGKEADFVALDPKAGHAALSWHQSLATGDAGPTTIDDAASLLFGMMMVGDERNVDETWIMGRRVYKKASGPTDCCRSSGLEAGAFRIEQRLLCHHRRKAPAEIVDLDLSARLCLAARQIAVGDPLSDGVAVIPRGDVAYDLLVCIDRLLAEKGRFRVVDGHAA